MKSALSKESSLKATAEKSSGAGKELSASKQALREATEAEKLAQVALQKAADERLAAEQMVSNKEALVKSAGAKVATAKEKIAEQKAESASAQKELAAASKSLATAKANQDSA